MKFTFVTLFQNIVEGYFGDSILKRAIQKDILKIESTNIYKNHMYDLSESKLYDFTKINLDNF